MKTSIVEILEEQLLGKKVKVTKEWYVGREKKIDERIGNITLISSYDEGGYHSDGIQFGFDGEHGEMKLMSIDPDSDIEILD